jgi:DNA-binding transcriptional regulator YdaS (Cro superfamily)
VKPKKPHPLKRWLFEQGRTAKGLAEELGVHPTLLPQWIRGDRVIPDAVAAEIARLSGGKVPVTSWTRPPPPAKA